MSGARTYQMKTPPQKPKFHLFDGENEMGKCRACKLAVSRCLKNLEPAFFRGGGDKAKLKLSKV